jgi:hypothetical protein
MEKNLVNNHYEVVAEKVKKIEQWAKENRSSYWYDDYSSRLREMVNEVKKYAGEHNVPLFINYVDIADKNYDDIDGYSEEESSYYEEESSYYDEEDEDEDEDDDESDY